MRILVGTGLNAGPAEYQNIGDIAMLQVAVARLAELWPDAEIFVLTDSPTNLARFCPAARPVSRYGAETWISDRILAGGLHHRFPASLSTRLSSMKRRLANRSPSLVQYMLRARFLLRDSSGRRPKLDAFLKMLRACDLLVICGAGGFADSCRDWNRFTLGLIEAALANGARVALFGQGFGPLSDTEVLNRMRGVLPGVALISSRGTGGARDIARLIGMSDEVFVTTGDDAVEPAYEARSATPGHCIGVNLRVAPYSGASESHADVIGALLREFSARQGAPLVPLPIAFHAYADDRKSINRLLGDLTGPDAMASLDSPQSVYDNIAQCRLVVTGAYHAALFALSQGIPAVCLCASGYYAAKFEGLCDLFGNGCTVVDLESNDLALRLEWAIDFLWHHAEEFCPVLLEAARVQIAESREAYKSVRNLFPPARQAVIARPTTLSIP